LLLGIDNLVTIAFVIYVVQFVKFNTRVKRFDQIKIGSEEMEAYILLGEPSKTICGIEGDTLREFWKVKLSENDLKGKKFMLLVYDGSIYLRKDLFLFYDMDSEKLVYKLKKWNTSSAMLFMQTYLGTGKNQTSSI